MSPPICNIFHLLDVVSVVFVFVPSDVVVYDAEDVADVPLLSVEEVEFVVDEVVDEDGLVVVDEAVELVDEDGVVEVDELVEDYVYEVPLLVVVESLYVDFVVPDVDDVDELVVLEVLLCSPVVELVVFLFV